MKYLGLPLVSSARDMAIGLFGNVWSTTNNRDTLTALKNTPNTNFEMMIHTGSMFPGGMAYNKKSVWEGQIKPTMSFLQMDNVCYAVTGEEDWRNDVTAILDITNEKSYKEERGTKMVARSLWYYIQRSIYVPSSGALMNGPNSAVNVGIAFIDTYSWCHPSVLTSDPEVDQKKDVEEYLRSFMNNGVSYRIVVGDAPIYSSASGTNWCLESSLRPLLKEYDVQLYVSGKDHTGEIIKDGDLTHLSVGHFNEVVDLAFKNLGTDIDRHFYAEQSGFAVMKLRPEHLSIQMKNSKGALSHLHLVHPAKDARGYSNLKAPGFKMPPIASVNVKHSAVQATAVSGTSYIAALSGSVGWLYGFSLILIWGLTLTSRHQRMTDQK